MRVFDYATNWNGPYDPDVSVYDVDTRRVIAIFPVGQRTVQEAETYAILFLTEMNRFEGLKATSRHM